MSKIVELTSISREKKQVSGGTLSVYSQIVGLKEKRYPTISEFPDFLFLDNKYLGSFFGAIKQTGLDGLERSQSTFWNEKKAEIDATQLAVGTSNNAGTLRNKLRIYFGRKALLHYHTHSKDETSKDSTWHKDFSAVDIAHMKSFPRGAYINVVGSDLGAVFVFQTEKSARLPVYSVATYGWEFFKIFVTMALIERQKYVEEKDIKSNKDLTINDIEEIAHRVSDKIRLTKKGEYLQDSGYGCYIWTPSESDSSSEGITLKKFDLA